MQQRLPLQYHRQTERRGSVITDGKEEYTPIKEISSGCYHNVRLFANASNSKFFTVKSPIISPTATEIKEATEDAEHESWNKAYEGTGLDIAEFYAFKDTYRIVLFYIENAVTIKEALKTATLHDKNLIYIAAANALAQLHSKGMAHGDVNDTNVLVRKEKQGDVEKFVAYWIDFQFSRSKSANASSDISRFEKMMGSQPRVQVVEKHALVSDDEVDAAPSEGVKYHQPTTY
ncbi:MAG: lipopolysaccharide kinase InaA family protein [Gammaproteobacteria bacterium]